MIRALLLGVTLLTLLPSFSGQLADAQAQPSSDAIAERLARGLELFADLEYREAIVSLTPIAVDPAASLAQRLRALETIGLSNLILGDHGRARQAFIELLGIDPGYQLRDDTGSPKILKFFDQVKREHLPGFDAKTVAELDYAAPSGATAGRRVEIEVGVKAGADQVKAVLLFRRSRGVLAWPKPLPLRRLENGRWRARFRAPASADAYRIEYYLEARGIAGQAVARVAGPETPLTLPVRGRLNRQRPWWQRWYTLAGGATIIGISTALIVTSGDSAANGTLQPGRVTLSP